MFRLTLHQFRLQAAIAAVALAAAAILLAITGRQLVHLYDTLVVPCAAQGNCDAAQHTFLRHQLLLQNLLGPFLMVAPALLGIFWGAPLVARELETGTYRLAWTQSVARNRWLAVKLALLGFASMVVAGLLSLMVTWWFSPFDKVTVNRFLPGVFDTRGIVSIGYAVFGFMVGVTAGVLLRRTLPAMGITLAAFLGVRLVMDIWVRPHLMSPAHIALPVSASSGLGFTSSSAGITFVADNPSIPNAWTISSHVVDSAGHAATSSVLHQFLVNACPAIVNAASPGPGTGTGTRAPANQTTFNNCIDQIANHYRLIVAYQPANRYWTFQWYETAIFVGLALILAGFCFWWVPRRLA